VDRTPRHLGVLMGAEADLPSWYIELIEIRPRDREYTRRYQCGLPWV